MTRSRADSSTKRANDPFKDRSRPKTGVFFFHAPQIQFPNQNKNISLTFEWSANNSKATFDNTSSDSTYVFNNYSGTLGVATSSTDVSICCTIKDGNLTISKPSKTIKFKKGIGE